MNFILIGIVVAFFLIVVLYFLNKKRREKNLQQEGEPWAELIQNFRRISPQITSLEELEIYLSKINSEVKKYETNYDFLIAFNSEIRKIREQLKGNNSGS